MPYLLNIVNETPEAAIETMLQNTINRAKDVWGLDYAVESDGLYPAGNQIGRTQFRPDHTNTGTRPFSIQAGGEWRTVYGTGGAYAGAPRTPATDANGWTNAHWLDFTVDQDTFLILEGVFTHEVNPTIHEWSMNLNGTQLPIMQVDAGLYATGTAETLRGYFEVPVGVQPSAEVIFDFRTNRVGLADAAEAAGTGINERFGPLGEVLGKRPYLIRQTY